MPPRERQSTRAILMAHPGAPEVLKLVHLELAPPGAGELRIRHSAIGVNYHDVYVRSGLYETLKLPGVPGIEAVGTIEAAGPGVTGFEVGDRIGYVTGHYGGYAEARNLDAMLAIKLPPILSDVQWAASLMKALTACMLVQRVHQVASGETVLVHAAAGGVGQLLCSWANHLGAHVIATVGSPAKAEIARRCGAEHVILYREQDVAQCVAEITRGSGVSVAYDSVGADTFQASIDSLGFEGKLVNFGQASGPVAPFSPAVLASRSLAVFRPVIFHYLRTPEKLAALANGAFEALARGVIRRIDPLVLPLAQAAEAHRLLEARQSPGGIALTP